MKKIIATDFVKTVVNVDGSVYSLDVINKSIYRLIDRASFQITKDGNDFSVKANAKDKSLSKSDLEGLIFDELLDQRLREIVRSETESARNLILANAFSNTKLIG